MPGTRTIPTISGRAQITVYVNDAEIPLSVQVISMQVMQTINKISVAKLVILDTDNNGESFPISNGTIFTPGAKIEMAIGSVDIQKTIFSGIITKQSLKLRNSTAPQYIIEARHSLVKATLNRKSGVFANMPDSDVITQLADPYKTDSLLNVDSTTVTHKELVQYDCTDWDFIVSRAQANGLAIMLNPLTINIKKPVTTGTPAITLTYGATLIELDAEIDNRLQFTEVQTTAWDAAAQALVVESGSATVTELGNVISDEIATGIANELQTFKHAATIPTNELKAWADSKVQKAKLSKVRGRAMIDGINDFELGQLVGINDAALNFNGNAWISGVKHDYDNQQGWKTQLQFGDDPVWWLDEHEEVHQKKAASLLPGVQGLVTAIVEDLEDPDGEFRVKINIPILESDEGIWARIAQTDAGNNRGLYFRPEVGDEVLVAFIQNDPRYPVIIGMLHSSALASPITPANDNHEKGFTTRQGIKMLFDDSKGEIKIETPNGNKLTLSDDAQGITMEDMTGNKFEMKPDGIKLIAITKLEIGAPQLVISGTSISMKGDGPVELKGGASSTIEASGVVTIKGAMVMIN